MSRGNTIIVSGHFQGRKMTGKITGTPKPGTVMQIDVSETIDANNRFTWEVFTATDGVRPFSGCPVLLEKPGSSFLMTRAYVTTEECQVYYPLHGDELNMIVADDASTTTEDHLFGDKYMVDSGTGKLINPSSEESEPFTGLEAVTNQADDYLMHCLYTGNH